MNKAYLLVICLFLTSLTGCLDEECELVPNGHCSGEDFSGQDLSGMNLKGIDLSYANLSGANLERANLANAYLEGTDFTGANLKYVSLTVTVLYNADFTGADLRYTDLRYAAYLPSANFEHVDLTGANFEKTDLGGANLSGINLHGADLNSADLRYAYLISANLTGANLTGADLRYDADFTDAIVDDAIFTGTSWEWTIWTDGVAYDENQAIIQEVEEETQDYDITVVEILDGDTFDLGNEERVRIIGINTPEKGRPFSDEATEALSEMIMGKEVTLVNDSKNDDADSSGRLLRHVYVDGISVNYEMIRTGMAFWYPYSSGTDMDESYQEAQESAANDHVGLWTESQYNITIDYIEYDPEGNEVDGEYLIITNHDNYNINMEGWYLQDEAARTAYEFNYTLDVDTSIRVYTGSGEDNETALFWGWYQGIWNNGGDMAILQDEDGLMVDYYRYGYD